MPLIRKKTSKRGTTNKRARIKGKVAESRKKSKRAAKTNKQWKSKQPKDPGIPSAFPYKDQILAEVAEERRLLAEAKEQQKENKKAAREAASFDGVKSLVGKTVTKAKEIITKVDEPMEVEDEPVPILLRHDLPTLKSVIDKSDVVLYLLDARDPTAFRSRQLEKYLKDNGKKVIFVVNKIDLVPREIVSSWVAHLRATVSHPVVLFRSASAFLPVATSAATVFDKGKGKLSYIDSVGEENIRTLLQTYAKEKKSKQELVVSVVGLTNTGKSSLINSLVHTAALPVYVLSSTPSTAPTTTISAQSLHLTSPSGQLPENSILLVDTPGLTWVFDETAEKDSARARDILLRSKGRIDRLKDPIFAVEHIVQRVNSEDLILYYNIPAYQEGDTTHFLAGLARANGMVKTKGVIDHPGAARIVLRDWSITKFPWFANAPAESSSAKSNPNWLQTIYDGERSIIDSLPTRKEVRQARGIVRLAALEIDSREVDLDADFIAEEDEEEEDEDDEEDDGSSIDAEEDDGMDVDEEDSDDEDEEVEVEEDVQPRSILKINKSASAKRVSFGGIAPSAATSRKTARSDKKPAEKIKSQPPPKTSLAQKLLKQRAASKPSAATPVNSGEEAYDFSKHFR